MNEDRPMKRISNSRFFLLLVGILLTAILIILVVRAYYNDTAFDQTSVSVDNTDENLYINTNNSVIITELSPADTLNIQTISLSMPGYVVVYDQNNGEPGEIIGRSRLLSEQEHQNVSLDLDRETELGEKIFILLHKDDGNGSFDVEEDDPLTDQDGKEIKYEFLVGENTTNNNF